MAATIKGLEAAFSSIGTQHRRHGRRYKRAAQASNPVDSCHAAAQDCLQLRTICESQHPATSMAIVAHLRLVFLAFLLACASATPAPALDRRLTEPAAQAEEMFHNGDLDGAVEKMDETRNAAIALLGAEHADVGEITARLALLEMYSNRIERAGELAEQALRIREHAFGELHPAVAA